MRAALWTLTCLLGLTLIGFASYGYPAPTTDAPLFLPTAISVELGRGLVVPLPVRVTDVDPTGQKRYLFHAPLFPLAVSLLMTSPTPRAAFLAVAVLRSLSLLMAAHFFLGLLSRAGIALDRTAGFLIAGSLVGLATGWLPTIGRPEALATVWVLAGAIAILRLSGWHLVVALGVALGLLGATHPFAAVEATLLIGLYCAAVFNHREALLRTGLVTVLGLAVFAVVMTATPHGLWQNLAGMVRAYGRGPRWSPPGTDWWRPWVTVRRSLLYGPLVLGALLAGAHLLARRCRDMGSRIVMCGFAALFAAALYHGSVAFHSRRNYNALVLSPILYGVALLWIWLSPDRTSRGWVIWARRALALSMLATTVGFLGHVMAFPWFLRHAHTLGSARAEWRRLHLATGRSRAMVGHAWVLSEDYDAMRLANLDEIKATPEPKPVLVLGQPRGHRGDAPPVPGFVLFHDFFNPSLADPPPLLKYFVEEDYSFAVYLPQGFSFYDNSVRLRRD